MQSFIQIFLDNYNDIFSADERQQGKNAYLLSTIAKNITIDSLLSVE